MGCILKLGNTAFDDTSHIVDESKPCKMLCKDIEDIATLLNVQANHL